MDFEACVRALLRASAGEIPLVAAIGEEVPSLADAPASYRCAHQLLAWRIYALLAPVVTQERVRSVPPRASDEQLRTEDLLDAIPRGGGPRLSQALDEFWARLFYVPTPPPYYLYGMCNYAVTDVQNKLLPYAETPLDAFTKDAYAALAQFDRCEDIKAWLRETFEAFARELASRKLEKNDPIIEASVRYIRAHIFECVRAEDVCACAHVSKSYFTGYFKRKTGQNFRDYVLNMKIVYAQEHLRLGDLSFCALSDRLGYEDYRSFNRAFKARTGFSPSEYQRLYRGENA